MRSLLNLFEQPQWLLLLPVALLVLGIMLFGDSVRRRAYAAFGDPVRIDALVTFDASTRRTIKGALRVLAVTAAVIALARPRSHGGQKYVPATDVRAMVVLDVSKSMYAQDVLPSRFERARSDATRMILGLPQVRWGAVAFAGEALAYPTTTDARAAANFLAAHEPITMPGGTAIAKALELARQNLAPPTGEPGSPPTEASKKRVIVLITDGEDLEGDPASVARLCLDDGIKIHVVAIGGRAPQPIPYVDPDSGVQNGLMRDEDGTLVTTELSPQAETQLKSIATETKGLYVRADDGSTGVAAIESELKRMITTEGTERVDTLWEPRYDIPLGIAVLLLLIDVAIGEARRRRVEPAPEPPPTRTRVKHAR
jgi:Ca-activated chloride channel family protein